MLHLNYLIKILSFSAISAVNANPDTGNWGKACRTFYDTGISYVNVGQASSDLRRACYGWDDQRGFYQDMYFKPWNESPYTAKLCINQDGYTHLNVEIGNLNPTVGFTLRPDDCNKELQALLYTSQGSEEQQYGWYFRVDPNAGLC